MVIDFPRWAAAKLCASASRPASNLTQPWRIYRGQPPPSDHQLRILWNRTQIRNLHRGDVSCNTSLRSYSLPWVEMVTPPCTTEGTAALPNQNDFHHRRPCYTEQTVHTIIFNIYTCNGDRREPWANEVNNVIFRLTGNHTMLLSLSNYWHLRWRISLCWLPWISISSGYSFSYLNCSCAGRRRPSWFNCFLSIGIRYQPFCSCFRDHLFNSIPASQPRGRAQGSQSLASWRPTDSGASEAGS